MENIEAIRNRRSIRGFRTDPIPRKVLEELLEVCRWSPSSRNTQPWEFAILGGEVMEEIKIRLTEKIKTGADSNWDVPGGDLPQAYLERAMRLRDLIDGSQFYATTERLEEKRTRYWIRGGGFHNAPNGIIIYIEKALFPRALLCVGMIAQTICLAALTYGLGTCTMARPVYWPNILRELLRIPQSKLIVLGIAIGYPILEAPINNFERQREPIESFTHWYGV